MAEVYRARGKGADGTEYFYAVKRILPEFVRDPEIKRMFIEESRVAQCLIHPNVVRVYDLATSENEELFIVMEFLEGKDLSEAIEEAEKRKKPLPIWFSIQVAKEVLRSLHYVTTEATDRNGRPLGLIHRDISPHNIFLCFDGQVKLTDFGVAKVQESNYKTQVGITKGKLGYMSPEQLMGSPTLDFRSDLYNVGILLYESITGKSLFAGGSPAEFLQAMVRGVVPPIPTALQVPPELDALIRRSLERDRNKRPASAAEFLKELDRITAAYNLSAQPAHVSHQLKELYGRLEPPKLAKPVTAPQKLKSMMLAALPAQAQAAMAPQPAYAPAMVAAAPQPTPVQPSTPAQQTYPPQAQQPYPPTQQPYPAQPYPSTQQPYPSTQQPYPSTQQPYPSQAQQPYPSQQPYPPPQPQAALAQAYPPQPAADDVDAATLVRPPEARPSQRPPSRGARLPDEGGARQPSHPRTAAASMPAAPAAAPVAAAAEAASVDTGVFSSDPLVTADVPRAAVQAALSESSSSASRRPATVARGNARPLEEIPRAPKASSGPVPAQPPQQAQQQQSGSPTNGTAGDDNATRVEANPLLRPPPTPLPPAPTTSSSSSTPKPTVTVGNSSGGVKSKRVVPLDDTRKR